MRTWDVLLVGGGSGTGKTTLAHRLSAALEVPYGMADDYRLFGQRLTSPTDIPELHYFVADEAAASRAATSVEEQQARLAAVAAVVSRGLEVVIAHHLATHLPLILEGDAIMPALAVEPLFAQQAAGRLRGIFLHEPDEAALLDGMRRRGRGIERLAAGEQRLGARLAWLHGAWICGEARRLGLPVLPSRPLESLADRALDALAS